MKKNIFIAVLAVFAVVLSAVVLDRPEPIMPEPEISVEVSYIETVSIAEPDMNEKILNVPALCQYPSLPTGCESTAATMVLQYYGENISPVGFAQNWLVCSADFYNCDGVFYGPDPNEVFAGDPFSEYAYGCFSAPIADAVNNNSSLCTAEVLLGKSLEYLCSEYIDSGRPLLIWATMDMQQSYDGKSWITPNGSEFTWIAREHCLVLVGYSTNFYFLNDPQSGVVVAYEKTLVEQRYKELGSQAILIT